MTKLELTLCFLKSLCFHEFEVLSNLHLTRIVLLLTLSTDHVSLKVLTRIQNSEDSGFVQDKNVRMFLKEADAG